MNEALATCRRSLLEAAAKLCLEKEGDAVCYLKTGHDGNCERAKGMDFLLAHAIKFKTGRIG